MTNELETLCDLYKNNRTDIITSDSNVIEIQDKLFDDYLVTISMNRIEEFYYIYLFIEKEKKIIFKGLLKKSSDNLLKDYKEIVLNMYDMKFDDFISNYYKILKENF